MERPVIDQKTYLAGLAERYKAIFGDKPIRGGSQRLDTTIEQVVARALKAK